MRDGEQVFGPGCPWYGMYETWGPPNVKWCEERLCAWINEPANTWTNVPYILFGLWIMWYSHKRGMRLGRFFGFASVIIGVTSFAYHATNNFLTQVVDFFGMYVYVYLLLVLNLWRLKKVKEFQVYPLFWGLVCFSIALIPVFKYFDVPYQFIIPTVAVGVVITELQNRSIYKKSPTRVRFWPFTVAIITFLIAISCLIADVKRWECNPHDHIIQGHALWHVFGSIGIFFSFLYYRQFMERKNS